MAAQTQTQTQTTVQAGQARVDAARATVAEARDQLTAAQREAAVAQAALDRLERAEIAANERAAAARAASEKTADAMRHAHAGALVAARQGDGAAQEAAQEAIAAAESVHIQAIAARDAAARQAADLGLKHDAQRPAALAALAAARAKVTEAEAMVDALEEHATAASAAHGQAIIAALGEQYAAIAGELMAGYAAIERARSALGALETSLTERQRTQAAQVVKVEALRSFDTLAAYEQFLSAHYAGAGRMAPVPQEGSRIQMLNIVGRVGLLEQALVTAVTYGARSPSVNQLENRRRQLAPFTQAAADAAKPAETAETDTKGA